MGTFDDLTGKLDELKDKTTKKAEELKDKAIDFKKINNYYIKLLKEINNVDF